MSGLLQDVATAFRFLTRLPVPAAGDRTPELARAVWAFPVVGAFIGAAGAAVLFALDAVGVSSLPAAGLAIATQILLTGALHEDGFADVADGLGGGGDKEAKLAIMRDSRLGVYGVIALVLALGLRWTTVAALDLVTAMIGLVVAATLARCGAAALLAALKPARADGLGVAASGPPMPATITAIAIGAASALVLLPPLAALLVLALGAGSTMAVGWLAVRQVGGHTGDVLGAAVQVVEVAVLIGVVALTGS